MRRKYFDYRSVPRRQRAMILGCMLFWSVLSYLAISRYVISAAVVTGISMEPTLLNGDRFLLNKIGPRLTGYNRGEIVAIRLAGDEDLSVKRVIALPHERVQTRDGAVYVHRQKLVEPYLPAGTRTEGGDLGDSIFEVLPDCYFLLGDNRDESYDSRFFGAIHRSAIVGRIMRSDSKAPRDSGAD